MPTFVIWWQAVFDRPAFFGVRRRIHDVSSTVLERVARGDQRALTECLALYGGLVHALVRRYSPDPADAEDAVQEVFIDLWRHASRFDPAIASESTFVAMVARRRLVDRSRKSARSVPTTPISERDASIASTPLDRVGTNDEAGRIRELMEEIRPEQRTVLEMAIDRDMSHAAIAKALDLPLGTVKAHARRGLLRLRELASAGGKQPLAKGAGS